MIGTTLRTRPAEQKAALVQAFAARVVPLLADGRGAPRSSTASFPLDDVPPRRSTHVRQPGKFGKLLLEMPAA